MFPLSLSPSLPSKCVQLSHEQMFQPVTLCYLLKTNMHRMWRNWGGEEKKSEEGEEAEAGEMYSTCLNDDRCYWTASVNVSLIVMSSKWWWYDCESKVSEATSLLTCVTYGHQWLMVSRQVCCKDKHQGGKFIAIAEVSCAKNNSKKNKLFLIDTKKKEKKRRKKYTRSLNDWAWDQ